MILRYNSFINEDLLFESLINETYVYYVKDFKDVLYKLSKQSEIAKDLIDLEYRDVKNDMTFISLSDREGYISGSTLRNLKNNVEKSFTEWAKDHNLGDERTKQILDIMLSKIDKGETTQTDVNHFFNEYGLKSKSRNDVKLGRLINALLPGKYTSKDIEEFTNKFKAALTKGGEYFEEVSGDNINHWYNADNYKEMSGTLGNSCMARKSGLFTIYTENPDVCKMLILVEDDQLIGRALVWKLSSIKIYGKDPVQDSWFMDRQYTIKDSDVEKFRNYAKEKGWIYKSSNNHHSFSNVTIEGEEKNATLEVQVKAKNYRRYPYMDTFRRFDPNEGILYNDSDDEEEYEGQYILNDTGGGYEEIASGVWSEWYDRRIPHDEAVWSDWADSYLDRDRSIYVETGSRRFRDKWYPDDCDDIVYDEWIDQPIHTDDAVYSEPYQYWIFDQTAVKTIIEVYSDCSIDTDNNWHHKDDSSIIEISYFDDMLWYKKISDEQSDWDDFTHILKSLLTKNYKDKFILKTLGLETYKVVEPKSDEQLPIELDEVEYLREVDALILGYDIDKSDMRIDDKVNYNNTIKYIIPTISKRINSQIKNYNNLVSGKGQLKLKFKDFAEAEHEEKLRNEAILINLQARKEELENREFIYQD
jgi:hypothetical protein